MDGYQTGQADFLISGTKTSTLYWARVVKRLVIFLNELSCNSDDAMTPQEMLPHVLSTLGAIRAAKKLRSDIVVASPLPIAGVFFAEGTHSLAAVLRGDAHKDEWRFIKSLDQSSPWGPYPDSEGHGELQEVKFEGETAIGMLWAKQNGSIVFSFAFRPSWNDNHIQAQFSEMSSSGNETRTEVRIPNLSMREHASTHTNLITEYGRNLSPSSLVYESMRAPEQY
jgi:hypothetical protein